jgi:hypothetical protein
MCNTPSSKNREREKLENETAFLDLDQMQAANRRPILVCQCEAIAAIGRLATPGSVAGVAW